MVFHFLDLDHHQEMESLNIIYLNSYSSFLILPFGHHLQVYSVLLENQAECNWSIVISAATSLSIIIVSTKCGRWTERQSFQMP